LALPARPGEATEETAALDEEEEEEEHPMDFRGALAPTAVREEVQRSVGVGVINASWGEISRRIPYCTGNLQNIRFS
jgi:hypothetical protein